MSVGQFETCPFDLLNALAHTARACISWYFVPSIPQGGALRVSGVRDNDYPCWASLRGCACNECGSQLAMCSPLCDQVALHFKKQE
jgi:hypothetical protein